MSYLRIFLIMISTLVIIHGFEWQERHRRIMMDVGQTVCEAEFTFRNDTAEVMYITSVTDPVQHISLTVQVVDDITVYKPGEMGRVHVAYAVKGTRRKDLTSIAASYRLGNELDAKIVKSPRARLEAVVPVSIAFDRDQVSLAWKSNQSKTALQRKVFTDLQQEERIVSLDLNGADQQGWEITLRTKEGNIFAAEQDVIPDYLEVISPDTDLTKISPRTYFYIVTNTSRRIKFSLYTIPDRNKK